MKPKPEDPANKFINYFFLVYAIEGSWQDDSRNAFLHQPISLHIISQ
jgi:hypothetical protein